MSSRILATAMAAALLAGSAAAHAQQTTTSTVAATDVDSGWRMTKLMGLDVYNDAKEKIGDIDEVLIDEKGNVKSVVIGVGGFLEMGEHDVALPMEQLRFSETAANGSATTGSSAGAGDDWAPDHATVSVTKEQLKAMPEFKLPADT